MKKLLFILLFFSPAILCASIDLIDEEVVLSILNARPLNTELVIEILEIPRQERENAYTVYSDGDDVMRIVEYLSLQSNLSDNLITAAINILSESLIIQRAEYREDILDALFRWWFLFLEKREANLGPATVLKHECFQGNSEALKTFALELSIAFPGALDTTPVFENIFSRGRRQNHRPVAPMKEEWGQYFSDENIEHIARSPQSSGWLKNERPIGEDFSPDYEYLLAQAQILEPHTWELYIDNLLKGLTNAPHQLVIEAKAKVLSVAIDKLLNEAYMSEDELGPSYSLAKDELYGVAEHEAYALEFLVAIVSEHLFPHHPARKEQFIRLFQIPARAMPHFDYQRGDDGYEDTDFLADDENFSTYWEAPPAFTTSRRGAVASCFEIDTSTQQHFPRRAKLAEEQRQKVLMKLVEDSRTLLENGDYSLENLVPMLERIHANQGPEIQIALTNLLNAVLLELVNQQILLLKEAKTIFFDLMKKEKNSLEVLRFYCEEFFASTPGDLINFIEECERLIANEAAVFFEKK